MSGKRIVMWQVPKEHWQGAANRETIISPFVRDALDIESRLPKGVNLGNERMRYQLCCRRIQNAVLQGQLASEHEFLDEDIFYFLWNVPAKAQSALVANRLAACFFPPELVEKAIIAMEAYTVEFTKNIKEAGVIALKKRLQFFKTALTKTAGVVETFDFLVVKAKSPVLFESESFATQPMSLQAVGIDEAKNFVSDNGSRAYKRLLAIIEQAIHSGATVNFSNQPHQVVTEVLNAIVYSEEGKNPAAVRVVYMDGTEAEPFPVRCLQRTTAEHLQGEFIRLRASLVSMRHLEMDGRVDFAWFRNRQVSSGGSFAEVDAFCTTQTMNLLKEMSSGHKVILEMYQTGLETAVVGFYRGLVRFLMDQQGDVPTLQVVPMYYNGSEGDYEAGKIWA
jgi:hypothetical protein